MMGVYQVRNLTSGKVLIGSSTDVPAMLNRQQAQLRLGVHPNRQLQVDWQSLGPDAFAFEILDTLAPPDEGEFATTSPANSCPTMNGGLHRPRAQSSHS